MSSEVIYVATQAVTSFCRKSSLAVLKVFLSDNRVTPKNPIIYQKIFLLHLKLYKTWGILQKYQTHRILNFFDQKWIS